MNSKHLSINPVWIELNDNITSYRDKTITIYLLEKGEEHILYNGDISLVYSHYNDRNKGKVSLLLLGYSYGMKFDTNTSLTTCNTSNMYLDETAIALIKKSTNDDFCTTEYILKLKA